MVEAPEGKGMIRWFPGKHTLLQVILLSSLASGCSTLSSPELPNNVNSTAESIQGMQRQVRSEGLTSEQREDLQQRLNARIQGFSEELQAQARFHERNEEWYQATQILAAGLRVLPDNPDLSRALDMLNAQRDKAQRSNQWRAAINEARYQLERRNVLKERLRIEGELPSLRWQLQQAGSRLDSLAPTLRNCARQSMRDQLWTFTADCIELARQIRGPGFVAAEQADYDQHIQSLTPVAPLSVKIPTSHQRLREQLESSLTRGDLVEARNTLEKLLAVSEEKAALRDLQTAIDQAIAARIGELEALAAEYYRSQDYPAAKQCWQEILTLQPEHAEARNRLERVERVIQSLEQLRSPEAEPLSE